MKRVQFSSYFTQYFFIAPQLAIILIFLYLPIVQTFRDAFTIQDAFGFGRYFSGFDKSSLFKYAFEGGVKFKSKKI